MKSPRKFRGLSASRSYVRGPRSEVLVLRLRQPALPPRCVVAMDQAFSSRAIEQDDRLGLRFRRSARSRRILHRGTKFSALGTIADRGRAGLANVFLARSEIGH